MRHIVSATSHRVRELELGDTLVEVKILPGRPVKWRGEIVGSVRDARDDGTMMGTLRKYKISGRWFPVEAPATTAFLKAITKGGTMVEFEDCGYMVYEKPDRLIRMIAVEATNFLETEDGIELESRRLIPRPRRSGREE